MNTKLDTIHENISPAHYDVGIQRNLFQRYWHWRRFKEVLSVVDPLDGNIADLGCHSGLFTEKIVNVVKPKEIYGVDISKVAIERAKKRIKGGNFLVGDIQKLPLKNNYFDAVFCLEVLEHVDYPKVVLKEMYRIMKRGGYGLVLVPTDNFIFKIVWFLWNLRYPVWKHVHVQSFEHSTLESLIKETGFRIIIVKSFHLGMLKLVKFRKN